ncbi:outer membrane beta-barrel protein [Salegentibacter sp. BLCTC]|uniref:outer membrane beta-barrel protein n=1 Tax=Salegentibacter sp. BLCTC TaxID=2697368 RepID=UPI00187B19A1|nr:outer membrane beta-barrel protein [Salegentibacter sp. BLCTC]MBE7641095.1 outer membrane beta-barrel protein [Salegentibacter sp. BLCTC]
MNNKDIIVYKERFLLKLMILVVLISVTGSVLGQTNNEVSFILQGSFSKLDYKVLNQKSEMKNGFGFGAGYAFYLSENWSIGTGTELQYIEGSVYLPIIEGAYRTRDQEGENFEFRYQAKDFYENQYAYFLNIPLKIQYETKGITRFYAGAGIKAGLSLKSEYKSRLSSLVTSGYYPQYDVELKGPGFVGFGKFDEIDDSRSEFDINTSFILNLESGVKLILENKKSLYVGGFLDYGLNNIRSGASSEEKLIRYNSHDPIAFSASSLLNSRENSNSGSFIDEIRTFVFGLKLRYAFKL